jgi:hypothetical protein
MNLSHYMLWLLQIQKKIYKKGLLWLKLFFNKLLIVSFQSWSMIIWRQIREHGVNAVVNKAISFMNAQNAY